MGRKKNKLVYGYGINDVIHDVTKSKVVNGKKKIVWVCPYYEKWKSIIRRCFDIEFQKRHPTYLDCTVSEEWRYLSKFIEWVDSQPNRDWLNCEPDKDLLFSGNKHYSAETVVYVPRQVNSFIKNKSRARGEYMIGVDHCPKLNRKKTYRSTCCNPLGKRKYLGMFHTELEAHKAWQAKKHEYACMLASMQEDERLVKCLRAMYAPETDWTKI